MRVSVRASCVSNATCRSATPCAMARGIGVTTPVPARSRAMRVSRVPSAPRNNTPTRSAANASNRSSTMRSRSASRSPNRPSRCAIETSAAKRRPATASTACNGDGITRSCTCVEPAAKRGACSSTVFTVSSHLTKVNSTPPNVMRSPTLAIASFTRLPFRYVPFREPRSRSSSPFAVAHTSAWRREIPTSRIGKSLVVSRPSTRRFPSGRKKRRSPSTETRLHFATTITTFSVRPRGRDQWLSASRAPCSRFPPIPFQERSRTQCQRRIAPTPRHRPAHRCEW